MTSSADIQRPAGPDYFVIIVSASLLLIRFVPFFRSDSRLWGINHLLYLPPLDSVMYAIFGLLCLSALIPKLQPYGLRLFDPAARFLMERRYPILFLVPAAILFFWIFRIPTFFLGDGYYVINNVGNELPVVFKWSEEAAVQLVFLVSKLVPLTGPRCGEYAYAVVSVISGGVAIWCLWLITREISGDGSSRLLGFMVLICSGWSLLFFGYAENYPLLWPFMTAYIYFSIRHIKGDGPLYQPTLLLAISLALHLQTLFFVISYPFVLFAGDRGQDMYRKFRRSLLMLAGAGGGIGLILFMYLYRTSLDFRIHFLPLWDGRPARPDYALLTVKHLADIANLIMLLSPVAIILFVLAWKHLRRSASSPVGRFLLVFTIGGSLFLFLIDPKLGLSRDWDLFALTGLGPTLFLLFAHSSEARPRHELFPALAGLALVLTMPFLAVNLNRQPSIDRYIALMRLDPEVSRGGMVVLRSYYYMVGDTASAEAEDREIYNMFPAVRLVRRATDLSRAGRGEEAMILADSVLRIDPYSKEAYNLRGMIFLRSRDYQRAIADLEQASRLGQYDARIMVNLAQAYFAIGDQVRTMRSLRKAQDLNPNLSFVIDALATTFYGQQVFDSALVYGRRLIQIDSTLFGGYKIAGFAAYRLGDSAAAKTYLRTFIELNPLDPETATARAILQTYDPSNQN
jgi:tetratricopeptide (TPR) repeat protein